MYPFITNVPLLVMPCGIIHSHRVEVGAVVSKRIPAEIIKSDGFIASTLAETIY